MSRRQINPWERLGDSSRRTVVGFVLKLALVVPLIVFQRNPVAAAQTITLLYALWCAVFAVLLRQGASGPNLNYWDEALWFLAAANGFMIWREQGAVLQGGG